MESENTSSTGRPYQARYRAVVLSSNVHQSLGGLDKMESCALRDSNSESLSGGSKNLHFYQFPSWCGCFQSWTTQDSHVAIFTALIELSEKIENKINTGKRHMWQKKAGSNFRSSLLNESQNMCWTLAAASCDNTCQMTKKLNRDSTPRVLIEYWSYRHPLSDRHQHSRLPGGKQAFTMNHIVCTVKAYWATLLSSGNDGELPRFKFPDVYIVNLASWSFSLELSQAYHISLLLYNPSYPVLLLPYLHIFKIL